MPKLIVTTNDGKEQMIDGDTGQSVMEVIRNGGIVDLLALCGGCCSCATCHVYVDPAFAALLPPATEDEDELLSSSSSRTGNSRLSCQLRFSETLDGMRVRIAPED
jgi:2Fe-2S ferredoxin